jgi:hypothetical protein
VKALVEVGELQLVEVFVLGCFDVDLLGHGDQMLPPKLQRRWMIRRSDDQRMA